MICHHIELDDETWQLLAAVAAGRVRRHPIKAWLSPQFGEDWQDDPAARSGSGYRRAARRLGPLRRLQLVELHEGAPGDESWPWQLTSLGELALAAYRTQTEGEA